MRQSVDEVAQKKAGSGIWRRSDHGAWPNQTGRAEPFLIVWVWSVISLYSSNRINITRYSTKHGHGFATDIMFIYYARVLLR